MYIAYRGSLDNPKSIGTNTLIKQGAKIALSPEDIVINYDFLHKVTKAEIKQIKTDDIEEEDVLEEYRTIYSVIKKTPIELNEIAKKSKVTIGEAISKLTFLEIEGKITKVPGNRYIRVEE